MVATPQVAAIAGDGLRARKKRAQRAQIIAIAAQRFAQFGYAQTNMRDIANEAGIAYQTLYNYFPNKAQLAIAWLAEQTRRTDAVAYDFPDASLTDPLTLLLHGAAAHLDMITAVDRVLWREVVAEFMHRPQDFEDEVQVLHLGTRERLRGLLIQCVAAGSLRPETDVEALGDVIYVIVDHAMLRFSSIDAIPADAVQADVAAQLELVLKPWLV